MIDLHVHLDGSLSPQTAWELARRQHIDLGVATPMELKEQLTAPARCGSLSQYLKRFQLPLSLLQSAPAIAFATCQLARQLNAQKLLYAEIRFAPQLHTQRGLSQLEVVQAALQGLGEGIHGQRMRAQLILCCMRRADNEAENSETVRLAGEFLGAGVCGVDLAGDESRFATRLFAPVFDRARSLGVPITIHAGEAAGPESVRQALEMGASRIGHGVRAMEDMALVEQLADQRVALEICPTSNVQTGAVESWRRLPIRDLLAFGVPCTVNSDNMAVSETDIGHELMELKYRLGMTWAERCELLENAAQSAFLPVGEKRRLVDIVRRAFLAGDWRRWEDRACQV